MFVLVSGEGKHLLFHKPTQSVTDDSTPGKSVVSFVIKCVIVEVTDNVPFERSNLQEATTSTPSHELSQQRFVLYHQHNHQLTISYLLRFC